MSNPQNSDQPQSTKQLAGLALLALGVVYGDIGTSPLYALRECFHGTHAVPVNVYTVRGALSLIFWSLIIVISIKYLIFVLRADNRGEGGILALMALLTPRRTRPTRGWGWVLVMLGLFGAALLYGDGMITPAISVLSAVEGLSVATSAFDPYIIPITIAILIGLFAIQKHGTTAVGRMFGPVIFMWFAVLAVLGVVGIIERPQVLLSINPYYGLHFIFNGGGEAFLVLGSIFLVVTGGEALYADMGHFGPKPIRFNWFSIVLPALLLNYFGQGAWILDHPEATSNTFFALAPHWALFPLVGLATLATVIASQAVITGVYSLTMQAVLLDYAPRLRIEHKSESQQGQIYISSINWVMCAATISLVLGFRSSSGLAAAYGIAVTITMVITTILFAVLALRRWKWHPLIVTALTAVFLTVDLAFFSANIVKIEYGGWFPLVIASLIFLLFTTWNRGRWIVGQRLKHSMMPIEKFLEDFEKHPVTRVPGTAVFMSGSARIVPRALLHNLKHNKVLHERVVILTIEMEDVPTVASEDRLQIEELRLGFWQITGHYGFMEEPRVPGLLQKASSGAFKYEELQTTFFLGRESLLPTKRPGMALWRERLFAAMSRNSLPATAYFHVPPNRVIEVGMQIEL